MITTKFEFKYTLKKDFEKYVDTHNFKSWFRKDFYYLIKKYLKYLRYCEYLYNSKKGRIRYLFFSRKKRKLGYILNIDIPINVAGPGLTIFHGGIVINSAAIIGRNCQLHGNNCIGNKGIYDGAPSIGDNVSLGFGSVVIGGGITIGNNTFIGSNAVVTKSFGDNLVIGGVPAKIIKERLNGQ